MFAACSALVASEPSGVTNPYASRISFDSISPIWLRPLRRCRSMMRSTFRRFTGNSFTTRFGRDSHLTYSCMAFRAHTALTGDPYCGTPPSRRCLPAFATFPAPRKLATTGFSGLAFVTRTTASAVASHSVIACGVSTTTTASTPGSSRTASKASS